MNPKLDKFAMIHSIRQAAIKIEQYELSQETIKLLQNIDSDLWDILDFYVEGGN